MFAEGIGKAAEFSRLALRLPASRPMLTPRAHSHCVGNRLEAVLGQELHCRVKNALSRLYPVLRAITHRPLARARVFAFDEGRDDVHSTTADDPLRSSCNDSSETREGYSGRANNDR